MLGHVSEEETEAVKLSKVTHSLGQGWGADLGVCDTDHGALVTSEVGLPEESAQAGQGFFFALQRKETTVLVSYWIGVRFGQDTGSNRDSIWWAGVLCQGPEAGKSMMDLEWLDLLNRGGLWRAWT